MARTNPINSKSETTVVSLFSGGGGLDLGLEAVGFKTVFATDIDHHSCVTLAQGNRGSKDAYLSHTNVLQADVRALDPKQVLAQADVRRGEAALLAGGPPCQAFSVFGKRRGLDDPRGNLAFQYVRLLHGIRPHAFVFENVYGLLTMNDGSLIDLIVAELSNPGRGTHYKVSLLRLNAVDYGVPQYRDRVFLIGHLEGKSVQAPRAWTRDASDLFDGPALAHRTVADAFRGLPRLGAKGLANHFSRDHSERIIARYSHLNPGERDPKTRINRLDATRPSFTIIVGSDKGGGKGHVHPSEPREVSPRESARIQTFPDRWQFSGTSRHPIRQVGNAVPPLLGAAVGNLIRTEFFGARPVKLQKIVSRLDQQHLFPEISGED